MLKTPLIYLFLIVVLIAGIIFGFLVRDNMRLSKKAFRDKQGNKPPLVKTLFDTQTATIRGKITKVDGNEITVENTNKKITDTIPVADNLTIAKLAKNSNSPASSSGDINSLDLNVDVFIELQIIGGKYRATLIQYALPAPSLKPITPSKIPSSLPAAP